MDNLFPAPDSSEHESAPPIENIPKPTEYGSDKRMIRRSQRLRITAAVAVFACMLALLGLVGWGLAKAQRGQVSSGKAPYFSMTSFDGKKIAMQDLRGKVVIINFWASWCQPCRQEAAYLEQSWRKYKDRDVVFIGVDYVDTETEALKYIKEFGITYFNGPDVGTRISQSYNIKGVPETFYVAKNGELRGVKIGPLEPPELDNKIEELLVEPAS
jgi:cytochrome c biogenesis protein CcmG, thiol:disulfide interchange protein DsbE